jgi:hypothetical protein
MCRLIRHSQSDGVVQAALAEALRRFPNRHPAESIWWYAKFSIRFIHHQKLLRAWLGKADELQLLISPEALLKMKGPKGDCAVFTCLICAMLDCAGVPWEILTVAVDPRQPHIFSHVYPVAILENGERLPLDASHGKYPGWEVDSRRVSLRQAWDSAGNPIQDDSFFFENRRAA